jgi:hypothetical protein
MEVTDARRAALTERPKVVHIAVGGGSAALRERTHIEDGRHQTGEEPCRAIAGDLLAGVVLTVGAPLLATWSLVTRFLVTRSLVTRSLVTRSLVTRSLVTRSLAAQSIVARSIVARSIVARSIVARSIVAGWSMGVAFRASPDALPRLRRVLCSRGPISGCAAKAIVASGRVATFP